jgi:hypothetical protein
LRWRDKPRKNKVAPIKTQAADGEYDICEAQLIGKQGWIKDWKRRKSFDFSMNVIGQESYKPRKIEITELEAPTFDDGYEICCTESIRNRHKIQNRFCTSCCEVEAAQAGNAIHKPQKCAITEHEAPTFEKGFRFSVKRSIRIRVQIKNRFCTTFAMSTTCKCVDVRQSLHWEAPKGMATTNLKL